MAQETDEQRLSRINALMSGWRKGGKQALKNSIKAQTTQGDLTIPPGEERNEEWLPIDRSTDCGALKDAI